MLDPLVWIALAGLLGLGILDGMRRQTRRPHPKPHVRVTYAHATLRRRD